MKKTRSEILIKKIQHENQSICIYTTGVRETLDNEPLEKEVENFLRSEMEGLLQLMRSDAVKYVIEVQSDIYEKRVPSYEWPGEFLCMAEQLNAEVKYRIRVHHKKLDLQKVDEMFQSCDGMGMAKYLRTLKESDQDKMLEYLQKQLSKISDEQYQESYRQIFGENRKQNTDSIWSGLMDTYYDEYC